MSKQRQNTTLVESGNERLKTIMAIVILVIISASLFYGLRQKNMQEVELTKYPRYTIGEIIKTGYTIGPNSHSYTRFSYQVGDSVYIKSGPEAVPSSHTRFLVKFSAKNPEYYKFYENIPIPYYIEIAPREGWVKPPPEVATEDLR